MLFCVEESKCAQLLIPQTELAMRGSYGVAKGPREVRARSSFTLIRKNAYLVTLALVSPRRNRRSRAQTSIFTIENRHFLVQMAPEPSWPPDVSAESLEARSPQPGVLSQASSARIPQPGVLSQESAAKIPQPGILSQQSPANLFGVRAGVIFRNLVPDCFVEIP